MLNNVELAITKDEIIADKLLGEKTAGYVKKTSDGKYGYFMHFEDKAVLFSDDLATLNDPILRIMCDDAIGQSKNQIVITADCADKERSIIIYRYE